MKEIFLTWISRSTVPFRCRIAHAWLIFAKKPALKLQLGKRSAHISQVSSGSAFATSRGPNLSQKNWPALKIGASRSPGVHLRPERFPGARKWFFARTEIGPGLFCTWKAIAFVENIALKNSTRSDSRSAFTFFFLTSNITAFECQRTNRGWHEESADTNAFW